MARTAFGISAGTASLVLAKDYSAAFSLELSYSMANGIIRNVAMRLGLMYNSQEKNHIVGLGLAPEDPLFYRDMICKYGNDRPCLPF